MLNGLNILHWRCTTTDKFLSAFSSKWFFKEDKILIQILRQLKGYTATRFLREFRPKTGQEHKFWQFWNELLYELMILLNSLLYAN